MKGSMEMAVAAAPPPCLRDCVRPALVLTAVVGLDTLVVLPFQRGQEVVQLAVVVFALFASVIWCASLSIGLVFILTSRAGGLIQRVLRDWPRRQSATFGLRDDWLDGPRFD